MTSLEPQLRALVELGVPGVVAATSEREAAAGVAELGAGEPMTPEHRFRVGSVTKTFVAAVVLQLVEEGAFDLDDQAAPFIEGITIRQLLNHTSGLPDFYDDPADLFAPHRSTVGEHELLAQVLAKPRVFAPGDGWSYSNSNYVALGLLVEHATGSALRDELRRRIFEPAGLAATDYGPDANLERLARGYLPPDNPFVPGTDGSPVDATDLVLPIGEVVSTARDVARALAAILGGELLAPRSRAELLTAVDSYWDESDRYGLGIEEVSSVGTQGSPCGPAWGHFGFDLGYTTAALATASGDRPIVICVNSMILSEEPWELLGQLIWSVYCS